MHVHHCFQFACCSGASSREHAIHATSSWPFPSRLHAALELSRNQPGAFEQGYYIFIVYPCRCTSAAQLGCTEGATYDTLGIAWQLKNRQFHEVNFGSMGFPWFSFALNRAWLWGLCCGAIIYIHIENMSSL